LHAERQVEGIPLVAAVEKDLNELAKKFDLRL